MEISFIKKDIQKALELSYSIVEKRNTIPILSNIKLDAEDNKLRITSTDTGVSFLYEINAMVSQHGSTTIPARQAYEIIRKLPDEAQITMHCNNNGSSIKISLPGSNFSLPMLPADEFPSLENNDNYNLFHVNAEALYTLLNKTKHAASNEEIRYYLNGIYMHSVERNGAMYLVTVATDGHRLAKVEVELPEAIPAIPGVIIHKKAVNELIKLLSETVGDVTLGISDNKIMFKSGPYMIIAKVIDGNFPDYNKAIPQHSDKSLIVDADALARAIDLVTSVSSDKTRSVKLNIEAGKMVISASSELDGNAKGMQELSIEYTEEAISFGFNARYLLDALSALSAPKAKFSFTNHMTAMVLENPEDPNFTAVLMPMQI
jgi:DNA polymerase III subunit beta